MKYGGNTACVELRTSDDELIILDAGTGIRRLGSVRKNPPLEVRDQELQRRDRHARGDPGALVDQIAVPGGERQREFSFRTGVNIVMYALTGNYKADQVHVPALLERLGQ